MVAVLPVEAIIEIMIIGVPPLCGQLEKIKPRDLETPERVQEQAGLFLFVAQSAIIIPATINL